MPRRPLDPPSAHSYRAAVDLRRGQGGQYTTDADGQTVLVPENGSLPPAETNGVVQFDAFAGEIATFLPREPGRVVEIELVSIGSATLPVPAETFVGLVDDPVTFPAGAFRLIGPDAGGSGPILLKTAEPVTVDPTTTADGRIYIAARFEPEPSRQHAPGG